jgi:hypothetical protein
VTAEGETDTITVSCSCPGIAIREGTLEAYRVLYRRILALFYNRVFFDDSILMLIRMQPD